jgi:hypothetical protein
MRICVVHHDLTAPAVSSAGSLWWLVGAQAVKSPVARWPGGPWSGREESLGPRMLRYHIGHP